MRVGVAGAGLIVPTFLDAAALVAQMEIYALFARREEVRREICGRYNIPVGYDSYENMLADPKVDVVYIALPNVLHFSFAKQALEAGKHVILEKPFTVTYAEAVELAELARRKKRYLFEGITTIYNTNYRKMKELLPKLGEIKIVTSNYSQYSSRYDAFKKGVIAPAFDPKQAGGALMDLNIYNIHLIAGLFGKPKDVCYYPNVERDIDTSGILLMQYDGFSAVCIGAKDCGAPAGASIQGTQGCMFTQLAPPNALPEFFYQENKCEPIRYALADSPERLYYELQAFTDSYEAQNDTFFEKALQHSLMVMEILDRAQGWRK